MGDIGDYWREAKKGREKPIRCFFCRYTSTKNIRWDLEEVNGKLEWVCPDCKAQRAKRG